MDNTYHIFQWNKNIVVPPNAERLTLQVLPPNLADLRRVFSQCPNVYRLDLRANMKHIDLALLGATFTSLPLLATLDFFFAGFADKHLSELFSNFSHFTQLRELNLASSSLTLTDEILLVQLSQMSQLLRLKLASNNLSQKSRFAAFLPDLVQLQDLDLTRNSLPNEAAAHLALQLPALTQLRKLILDDCNLTTSGLASLAPLLPVSLSTLDLATNPIGDLGCLALAEALPRLPDLSELILSSCGITAKGVAHLVNGLMTLTQLSVLELNDNLLGNDSAPYLCDSIRGAAKLTVLSLVRCNLSDGLVPILDMLPDLPNIEHLRLSWNQFTPAVLQKLTQIILLMPTLRYLSIYSVPQDPELIAALLKSVLLLHVSGIESILNPMLRRNAKRGETLQFLATKQPEVNWVGD